MQPILIRLVSFLTILSVFFAACKKDHDIVRPNPQPPVTSYKYQFVVATLPGESNTGTSELAAQVMVVNEKNETVLENVKLALQFDGQYKTSMLELPDGQYRVVKFLINNKANQTRFAAPVTGSNKATQVSKPLYVSFRLPQSTTALVPVEVLRVEAADSPESFGYPAGAFNQVDGNPPPDTGNPFFKIKIRPYFKIGDVTYDSVPAGLVVTVIDNNGQATRKQVSLKAGTNEVEVPKAAVQYRFQISKWGISDELVLEKYQVHEESIYGIGGSRAAKKLKSEVKLKLVNGVYVPESKADYVYDASGKLTRINLYKKQSNEQTYLDKYDLFDYRDGKISMIHYLTGKDELLGSIAFSYGQNGKVSAMEQNMNGVVTKGIVTYFDSPGQLNAHIKYSFSDFYYTKDYTLSFKDGNAFKLWSSTSHGNLEEGVYEYDFNINPYIHLKLPDLYLSHESINNKKKQYKTYAYAFPEADPLTFDYTYDADGYPTQLISEYWAPGTQTRLYTLKTVYTYL